MAKDNLARVSYEAELLLDEWSCHVAKLQDRLDYPQSAPMSKQIIP